jgi:uncharacterized integral membrane protein
MKFLSGLIGVIVLFLALAFALANRQPAAISLWPLDIEVHAPLCLLTLGTFVLGLLLGAVIAWFSLLPHRFTARRLRKELAALQDRIGDLQQTIIPPRAKNDSPLLASRSRRRFWRSRS